MESMSAPTVLNTISAAFVLSFSKNMSGVLLQIISRKFSSQGRAQL
jgi:hypothetical protein